MGRAGTTGRRRGVAAALVLCALPATASAQQHAGSAASMSPLPAIDSVTVVPGPRYEEGGWTRFWLGDGWRDVWTAPVRVPVLDVNRFAGGLEMERQGGGNQSITLHMIGADGNGYVFRSVDKHPGKALPHDLRATPTGEVVQDLISALHPGGGIVVARLLDATPILHVHPRLVVMPDDPALGEYRETFAGMLGTIEEKPNEGEDDTPGFAGSRKIEDWEDLMDHVEDSPEHRLDTEQFVMARLFDVMLNDPDRAEDQWRAARFDDPDGDGYIYRPLPRDRDWALVDASGALVSLAGRRIYPKLISFERTLPKVRPVTVQAWRVDRPLLAGTEWPVWERAAAQLQASLTDAVIDDAVRALPPTWYAQGGERIAGYLRARRDAIHEFARTYYLMLAAYPDVHGSDENDRAEIVRQPDGDVLVVIADEDGDVWFRRRFEAHESEDIRIDLHGGDDVAIVRGPDSYGAPFVRIEGGGGDDTLTDATDGRAGRARLGFYDDRGDNTIEARGHTIVDRRTFERPDDGDWIATLAGQGYRDWGSSLGWSPVLSYGGASGLVVGIGPRYTSYGYRRVPYAWTVGVTPLFSFRHASLGVEADVDWRAANSPLHFELAGRATRFEGFRYFGLGNDTELETDDDLSLVRMAQARVHLLAGLDFGDVDVGMGPTLVFSEPVPEPGSALDLEREAGTAPIGSEDFGQIGARFQVTVDRNPGADERTGWALDLAAEAYPDAWSADEAFQTAEAVVRGYIDLPLFGRHPKLALRVGGRQAWGGWPVFEGAFIGGLETVRGYRFQRFRGDQAAWGNAELRLPLFELTLVTRGRVGAIGLADAGRVWLDGESEGDWHTSHGGGLFYETLGRSVSVLYAHGEEDRWYLQIGMPF